MPREVVRGVRSALCQPEVRRQQVEIRDLDQYQHPGHAAMPHQERVDSRDHPIPGGGLHPEWQELSVPADRRGRNLPQEVIQRRQSEIGDERTQETKRADASVNRPKKQKLAKKDKE